jgi:hemoglobin
MAPRLKLYAIAAVLALQIGAAIAQTSLFERLGGDAGIARIVAAFRQNLGTNSRLEPRFRGAEVPAVGKRLEDFICEVSGGPCRYVGPAIRDMHRGMGITNDDFDLFIGELSRAFDSQRVAVADRDAVLSRFRALRADLIEQ